ncbi:hypothetical protein JIR001_14430 [Polycladomyces abyssicola]|uniref:Uncharacterized protein n=1 Tax=Polycladomyces abyssicola TaxID=1125966 RepID=A0A8D5ZMG7_9BACL|nr:hypothetical protein JIR001_14430 [Polycladomyces abyssicola]
MFGWENKGLEESNLQKGQPRPMLALTPIAKADMPLNLTLTINHLSSLSGRSPGRQQEDGGYSCQGLGV